MGPLSPYVQHSLLRPQPTDLPATHPSIHCSLSKLPPSSLRGKRRGGGQTPIQKSTELLLALFLLQYLFANIIIIISTHIA